MGSGLGSWGGSFFDVAFVCVVRTKCVKILRLPERNSQKNYENLLPDRFMQFPVLVLFLLISRPSFGFVSNLTFSANDCE